MSKGKINLKDLEKILVKSIFNIGKNLESYKDRNVENSVNEAVDKMVEDIREIEEGKKDEDEKNKDE